MKILKIEQMQKAERESGITTAMLMENAGKAVADEIKNQLGDLKRHNILILIGPGNNGGDGLVAARFLYDWGIGKVKIYLCGERPTQDDNLEQIKRRSIHYKEMENDIDQSKLDEWLSEATAVVDAIFGTGKNRPIEGYIAQVLKKISGIKNKRKIPRVFALDLPSGLNADTGAVDQATPMVDCTLTLGLPKIGLFIHPGCELSGQIRVVDIGLVPRLVDYVNIELLADYDVFSILPERSACSHKSSWGRVLAVAGSINYPGAAYLACSGTIRVGAGLTTLAIQQSLLPILASKLSEVTYLPLPEIAQTLHSSESYYMLLDRFPLYDVLLLGCGLGQSDATIELINKILLEHTTRIPAAIIDADGINALSRVPEWWKRLDQDAILTPHAGEMARLTGKSIHEVQSNRIEIAQLNAARWNKTLVLKGAYTVIAAPDGRVRISPFANAGLATAGTGDVLAGAIAGFKAQGLPCFESAICGVYAHALAAELVKKELGDTGMIASDLLKALPQAIRQLKGV